MIDVINLVLFPCVGLPNIFPIIATQDKFPQVACQVSISANLHLLGSIDKTLKQILHIFTR